MKDEIKEIIDNIKKCCDIMEDNNFVVYQKQDILKILDYITNLQKENKKLKEQKKKTIEYIKEEGTTYLNLANQRKWCSEFSAKNILKLLGSDE